MTQGCCLLLRVIGGRAGYVRLNFSPFPGVTPAPVGPLNLNGIETRSVVFAVSSNVVLSTETCRCGPVENPLLPELPIFVVPATTALPTETSAPSFFRCRYRA